MARVPWLKYDHRGFCIGPRCGDCKHFTRERRSPLYDDLEIYDCWSCPFACHIWSNGKKWTCSSAFACRHFEPRYVISSIKLDPNEIIGEQLTLF